MSEHTYCMACGYRDDSYTHQTECGDREHWKARAEAAEKRAREAEVRAEAWKEHAVREESLASAGDTCRAELEAELREVEAKTIAAVIAWLEKRAYDGNEHEIALMVDAIAREDWRPKGREGGE